MKNINKIIGFTLIEIMIGILIFSFVIVGGFQALSAVQIGKVRLMQKIDTEKQNIYFTEKFFEEIKKGGTIDYEEYFNRKVRGTTFSSGHYDELTGFGNFGRGGDPVLNTAYGDLFYLCRSDSSDKMSDIIVNSSLGCFDNGNFNTDSYDFVSTNEPQRYGQYSYQFIDYNSNANDDLPSSFGDEDGDGNIQGDADDEFLGDGPDAFSSGVDLKELYLIGGDKKTRTLFRWNVGVDPDKPSSIGCSIDGNNVITGSGCLGTIEMLKLDGYDWGMDHDNDSLTNPDGTQSDGVIDTWLINQDYEGSSHEFAGHDDNRLPVFPDYINITDFKVYLYPNKDPDLAWKNSSADVNIAPYARIYVSMLPSWGARRGIKGELKEVTFSTTISLTDIFSK